MNINSSLQKTPIAVIGLSAIVADARNIEEFWMNIIQGKDSITDVPENRWRIEDYYDADMTAPDKTYCKRGGFLPDIDFNPMEFGLPPNILEVTDASQLLGLVAARDALVDAGYGQNSIKFTKELKEKTGVLLGVGGGQKLITPLISRLQYPIWEKALRESGIAEEDIPHIVDKMPHNFLHLGVIRRIFPDSKIVHCSRNPISNCYSSYKQHFSDFHSYSTDLDYLADYYKRYLKLMEFWRASVDGLNLIEISY